MRKRVTPHCVIVVIMVKRLLLDTRKQLRFLRSIHLTRYTALNDTIISLFTVEI